MKIFSQFLLFFALISCNQIDENKKLIDVYYIGLNNSDYGKIETVLSDTLTVISGEYIMKYSKMDYYDWFQWDSVFKPKYVVKEIIKSEDKYLVTTDKICHRITFLAGEPLTTTMEFEFKNNEIFKINEISYDSSTDWNKWTNRRDSLVSWSKIHHPELGDFIFTQDKQNGDNYLKAIELFTKN